MRTLIRNGAIVTCDSHHSVIHGDILIENGTIVSTGVAPRSGSSGRRQKGAPREDGITRVIDATGCAILPGFVQAHIHLCQTLFRGWAEDMPLLDWLRRRIWPLEAAHTPKSLAASADLGLLEMMLAGTTTILDMGTVFHHDAVMTSILRSGIRAFSGKAMMDQGLGVPKNLLETRQESLRESERLIKRWHRHPSGRIHYAFAPRFILSCSEGLLRDTAKMAEEHHCIVHTHAAEQVAERKAVREILGMDDIEALRTYGIAGERAVFAHGVQLTAREMKELAREKTRIVHCPSSNLKLGSGIASLEALDRAGVRVALGADGAPCNNNLDPWREMRLAAQLSKVKGSIDGISAVRALRLATIDGARALGIGDLVGSLEVGKRADLQIVELDRVHQTPGGDLATKLVHATSAAEVRDVCVDGVWVVRGRQHLMLDHEETLHRAKREAPSLWKRADVT